MFGLYLPWLHTVYRGYRRLHKSEFGAGTGPKALGEKCEKPNEIRVFGKKLEGPRLDVLIANEKV